MGVANTVRTALRSKEPPAYQRESKGSFGDPFEPEIRRLLMATPRMPATVIAERIGWTRSLTVLKERVRELRPLFLPPDPSGRTTYLPGELAQWDLWFPPDDVPLEAGQVARPPVIVGLCGYSRMMVGKMIPSREAHDILSGHLACLLALGAVPRAGVYDNECALVSRHGGKANLSDPFQRFRGTLGMKVIVLRPRDPEAKGVVERHNGYLETSFIPGRRFLSPAVPTLQFRMLHATHRRRSSMVRGDSPPLWATRTARRHRVRPRPLPMLIRRPADCSVPRALRAPRARAASRWSRSSGLGRPVRVCARILHQRCDRRQAQRVLARSVHRVEGRHFGGGQAIEPRSR